MTTNTSRRSFLIGTGGAALAVTLAACSSSPGSSSGGGGTAGSKTLTLTTNSDDDTSTWEVPQWNKQNPSTQIKLETYDTNTYTSTFPTLATSNDAPNIAGYFIDGGNYTTLAKAGAFDMRYPRTSDYDFMLRILLEPGLRVRYLDGLFVDFGVGGFSTSGISTVVLGNLECAGAVRAQFGPLAAAATFVLKPLRKVAQIRLRALPLLPLARN